MVRSTKLLEVSEQQLADEVAVYEQHGMNDTAGIEPALDKLRMRQRGVGGTRVCHMQFGKDLQDDLQHLYHLLNTELGGNPTKERLADAEYYAPAAGFMTLLPPDPQALPTWAGEQARNGHNTLPHSDSHYVALVSINNAYTKAIVNTGGARTMLDKSMAHALRLEVKKAGPRIWFGSLLGPSAKPIPYYGQGCSPVTLCFSEQVVFHLPELKVILHGEPLALLGTDILGSCRPTAWGFQSVGQDAAGYRVLEFGRGATVERVQLVHIPQSTSLLGLLPAPLKSPPRDAALLALICQGRYL